MPRTPAAVPAASARLRTLQARLPELSVPALLRVRDALEVLLERETIRVGDVSAVTRAVDD